MVETRKWYIRYSFEYINNITDAQMKKLVSIYTIIRRDYEIEADTDKQAVNLAYKNLSDYDDETREEKVMVDGIDFYQREVFISLSWRTDFAKDSVTCLKGIALDLALRYINVIGRIEVIVVR